MGRTIKHWTPRYIWNRIRLMQFQRAHPQAPCLIETAIALLEDWLQSTDCGLEWGSGRYTTCLARRVRGLVSVESNPTWYKIVDDRLRTEQTNNVRLHLAPVDYTQGLSGNHRYVQIGAEFPDASQDFVLVDGALRDFCTKVALSKLKPSGLLIIDNANWYLSHPTYSPASAYWGQNTPSPDWMELADELKNWRSIWTSNGVTDTAFFIRPPALPSSN